MDLISIQHWQLLKCWKSCEVRKCVSVWRAAESVWLICEMRMWFYVNIKLLEKCSLLCRAQRDLINRTDFFRVTHYAAKWQEQPLRNDISIQSVIYCCPSVIYTRPDLHFQLFSDIKPLFRSIRSHDQKDTSLWHAPTIWKTPILDVAKCNFYFVLSCVKR